MKTSFKYFTVMLVTLLALTFSAPGSDAVKAAPAFACSSSVTVADNADSGAGSLRQAIADVCSGGTINFDNDTTITLASQLEIIDKTVTITGAGHHITISGDNAVRVFHVGQSAGSGNLTIDQLNIVNGKSTVEECAGSAVSCGGGLMLEYITTATVLNSTFSNNDGGLEGGAIYSYYGNPLTVANSTFTNNHALAYAGAIGVFYGNATLTNNTFTGNSTSVGYGSTLLNTWGTVTLRNNIFVKGATSINACDSDFSDGGSTNDGGGNVRSGDNTCPGTTANPMLGALGDYGGGVQTMPLLPGSPVINAASANCPAVDARGVPRGATCDSGAFESQGFTLTKTGGDNQSTLPNAAFANPLTLSVTSAFSEPVDGGVVAFSAPGSGASAAIGGSPATISGGAVSVSATANGAIGSYNVTASAAGATGVNFSLANSIPTPTPTATRIPTITRTPTRTPTKTATKTPTPAAVTLTFKSTGAQDGWVLESNETGGVGGSIDATGNIYLGDSAKKQQYRAILSFNTGASLPDNAVITGVTLKVKQQAILGGDNPVSIFGGFMFDVKDGFFGTAAALQSGDFQAAAGQSYGPSGPAPLGGWYSFNLSTAKSYINKLTTNSGLTQIRLRFKLDDDNNVVANVLSLYSGNDPAGNQPQLVITYTVP